MKKQFLSLCFAYVFTLPIIVVGDTHLHSRQWKVSDGLAESFTRGLSFGPSGTAWIKHGPISLMSKFDGYSFHTIPNPGDKADVLEFPLEHIWSLYPGGLQLYENDNWVKYEIDNFFSEDNPLFEKKSFLPIAQNQVLIALPDRLILFDKDSSPTSVIFYAAETNIGTFNEIIAAQDGGVWVTGVRGILKLLPDVESRTSFSQRFEFPFDEELEVHRIQNVIEINNDELYGSVLSFRNGKRELIHFDGESWQLAYTAEEDIHFGWRFMDSGLYVAKGYPLTLSNIVNGTETPLPKNGILSGNIENITVKSSREFWVASSFGIGRFTDSIWKTSLAVKEIDFFVHAIHEDSQSRIWFDCFDKLVLYQNRQWKIYPLPDEKFTSKYRAEELCSLPDGRILLRSRIDHTLLAFDPEKERFETIRHPDDLSIFSFFPRKDGTIWIQAGINIGSSQESVHEFGFGKVTHTMV